MFVAQLAERVDSGLSAVQHSAVLLYGARDNSHSQPGTDAAPLFRCEEGFEYSSLCFNVHSVSGVRNGQADMPRVSFPWVYQRPAWCPVHWHKGLEQLV